MNYKLQVTLSAFLLFCFLPSALFAQKLFSISQNNLLQDDVVHLKNKIAQSNVSELLLTRNNEDKNVYVVPLSSEHNTRIIILNEETGKNVVISPTEKSHKEFLLAPFLIEELKQATLEDASRYLIMETTSDYTIKNVVSVSVSNDAVYIPRYFYGKKGDMKEALPKDRQIVGIYKQKPQLISAFPDDINHQHYIAQLEEEMSYYIYMYKLPDGTLCTYDEHFNPTTQESSSISTGAGNFLQFSLTGVLNDKQRLATEYALELWSEQLAGTVPVKIQVNIIPLDEGVIGMSFFPPVRGTDTLYPSSLWKQLVGEDLDEPWDIAIVMSSKFNFYYELDGNTNRIDYVTIMIHEVTHGLGFGCYCHPSGEFFYNVPGIYDCMLYKGLNGPSFLELTEDERAELMVSNNLYSGSPESHLLKANNNVRVKMYAPTKYSGGSTAHHWDSNVGFTNFMGYAYTYPLHTFNNRKTGIFMDMGYERPVIDSNAVWITFHANSGKGTLNPQPFLPNEVQKIRINTFYKLGYSLAGWNTSPDGTGTSYEDRELITIDTSIDLYAQWGPGTFTLTFYPNQGTVSPKSKYVKYGLPIGELPTPTRKGYKFDGWSIGYASYINEETIWKYTSDGTATAKWSILTAIEETQNTESIQIFPNPTTGELTMDYGQCTVNNVEIYDVFGRKVYDEKNSYGLMVLRSYGLATDGVVIDLTVFPAGIYFLKITTENKIITKKFIKN